MRLFRTLFFFLLLVRAAAADIVCPDSSYVTVNFACTFTGEYRTGEPFDTITILQNNEGESLASAGITIRVYVKNCQGQPLVGVPADAVLLQTNGAGTCTCLGGNLADMVTDANGSTTFTGALRGTGCGTSLTVRVDGVPIGTVPVHFNSPAYYNLYGPSSCGFNFADNSGIFASHLGREVGDAQYSACFDFNEDGYIDVTDQVIMATMYAAPSTCTKTAASARPQEGQE